MWEALKEINKINKLPWLVAGDVSEIFNQDKKRGRASGFISLNRGINSWVLSLLGAMLEKVMV